MADKGFFSDLEKMENLVALEQNQTRKDVPKKNQTRKNVPKNWDRKNVPKNWEQDVMNPVGRLAMRRERPPSRPSFEAFEERSGSPFRGQGNRRGTINWQRGNINRQYWVKKEFLGPLPGHHSGQSSSFSSRGDISHRSSFHRHPARASLGGEERNQINYCEFDMESIEDLSSMGSFLSVSQQATSISPEKLAASLVEFPDNQTTLLTLLDECQYDHKKVREVVKKYPETFEIYNETVRLRPKIGMCRRYVDTEGCPVPQTCRDLHICLQYLTERCQDENCVYGHNFHTNHNKPILSDFHLSTMPVEILFRLVKSFVVPSGGSVEELEVCKSYNDGSCTDEPCRKLHLCLKLLAKRCSPDDGCKLNHNVLENHFSAILSSTGISLNESPRDILTQIATSPLIRKEIDTLKSVSFESPSHGKEHSETKETSESNMLDKKNDASSTKKFDIESDKNEMSVVASSGENEKPVPIKTTWFHEFKGDVTLPEICYDSVEGFCSYEESGCWRLHCGFHFHWQVRSTASDKKRFWINLTKEQALALEKAFCDPSVEKTPLPTLDASSLVHSAKGLLVALGGRSKWEADFDTMQLNPDKGNTKAPLELRRLCTGDTPNNPTIPKECVFNWYFLDKNQRWIEYGNTDSTGEEKHKCDITSDDIEKFRQQNGEESVMQFRSQSFVYQLDVKSMTQTNQETKVTRKVRRRPQPHIKEETLANASKGDLPMTWNPMQPEELVQRVVLSPSSQEYQNLMTHINNNKGSGINVLKIERVQNPYLWRAFQNKVQEMTSLYKNLTTVNVRQLFHGTNPDTVPKICQENFDWRLHGTKVGQAYGRGTYFSPFADTSYEYTQPDNTGNRFMFIARVAVGTMIVGSSSMARPPINAQYNVPYDATANAAHDPSIIVKYDKQEYFPEYIITMT